MHPSQINRFAESGLRTLVLAKRDLLEPEYNAWRARFAIAMCAMVDRQAQQEACYDLIERNLTLLGATAIEDRLQVFLPAPAPSPSPSDS